MGSGAIERERLAAGGDAWRRWGPYVSERAWGTVREDYSETGEAWEYFPHDHARSRAYRWSEDGLGGICDSDQLLCLAFAFWNGRDPILKERIFGLTGNEGNHGEDAKEYWWYLDSTPTHSWMQWRYFYPQAAFPYDDLVAENRRRGRLDPEYELLDTGVFDDQGFWNITIDYAKAGPDDLCIRVGVHNAGCEVATLDVLPTLWFRNTWSWGRDGYRPTIRAGRDGTLEAVHRELGKMVLAGDGTPQSMFCDNESNARRLWNRREGPAYPKDAIGDYVVHGRAALNPGRAGTKAALRYRLTVPGDGRAELRLRFGPDAGDTGLAWESVLAERAAEADAFYADLTPAGTSPEQAMILRRALAGMLWSKQYYHYDVEVWLDGDPAGPPPPAARARARNSAWRHLNNADVISMPDKWEYPWYAAWDLAFHCVALAHVDPGFAKDQLLLMCREWYMHPNGQLPAYEWSFGDVNPPVHAWAALRVFEIDGAGDFEFLERVLHKLLLNFTWWVNRKDWGGNNVFEGGFLGLDNIGPFDRSAELPVDAVLEQADGTAWMAMYCLNLLEMSLVLAGHDPAYEDVATKFAEHFAYIATAIHTQGLWSEEDGFYYDVVHEAGGRTVPLRVCSMVGLIPLYATTVLDKPTFDRLPGFGSRFRWFLEHKPSYREVIAHTNTPGAHEERLFSVVSPDRLGRILEVMLSEDEFLSPFGLRALSRRHLHRPFTLAIGASTASVDYQPGESTTGLFGGNSNWRGPVWFPVNYLVIEALRRFARYSGDEQRYEFPAGSGHLAGLGEIAEDLAGRLISIFCDDEAGRRPVFGGCERFQVDPVWHDLIPFHEYFHGETGMGLGAAHQTGWTGLVADLIVGRVPR